MADPPIISLEPLVSSSSRIVSDSSCNNSGSGRAADVVRTSVTTGMLSVAYNHIFSVWKLSGILRSPYFLFPSILSSGILALVISSRIINRKRRNHRGFSKQSININLSSLDLTYNDSTDASDSNSDSHTENGKLSQFDDIENIVDTGAVSSNPRLSRVSYTPTGIKTKKHRFEAGRNRHKSNALIPGTQNVFVKTFGCSHNISDSEFMLGQLVAYGYRLIDNMEESDVCVINSCTVKNPSQDAFMGYVRRARALNIPTVVSGCVPQADRTLKGIVEVVEQALQGHVVTLLTKKSLPSLDLPKIRKNPLVEIIPLSMGCLGSCSYCKTKHARGKLGSYDTETIIRRILRSADEGVKQIWLTSEDTGAYGLDINTNIARLLKRILSVLPPGMMLRIGMTNPPYMLTHIEAVGDILSHPQVFEFIHVPVQSGSDTTLAHMVREYDCADFDKLIFGLKARVPNITVATDIICGFPTETENDHLATLQLIEKHHFPILNISQFYPRPGTPAAIMKRIPNGVAKRRSREVTTLFNSYETYGFLLYTTQEVWFTEHSDKSNHSVGHTKQYIKVLIERDEFVIGRSCSVRITNVGKWHVVGERVVSGLAAPT